LVPKRIVVAMELCLKPSGGVLSLYRRVVGLVAHLREGKKNRSPIPWDLRTLPIGTLVLSTSHSCFSRI
jgi:hypothetical protein